MLVKKIIITSDYLQNEKGQVDTYEEFERVMSAKEVVKKADPKDKMSKWIFPGTHTFPFSVKLDKYLPHSLDDAKYGSMIYTAMVELRP